MKKFLSVLLCAVLLLSAVNTGTFAAEDDKNVIVVSSRDIDPFKAANRLDTDGQVTVQLRGGTYLIRDILKFTEKDRGNVTFMPYNSEEVTVTGAEPVSAWKETTVNGIKVFAAKANGKRISGLFKGETKLEPSRLPESGYYYVKSLNDDDTLWTEETTLWAGGTLGQTSFNADLKDISRAPANMEDVTIRIPHWWHDEVTGMRSFDETTGRVKMVKYSAMTIQEGDRYCFENILDGLDEPGEWCYDSSADMIYYVPEAGEKVSDVNISVACTSEIISIDGCDNITFKGITFENTGWDYLSKKYCTVNVSSWTNGLDMDGPQGAIDASSAIRVINSDNICLENCDFLNIGSTALKFVDNARGCSVRNCYFDKIGGSAIFVGGQNNINECAADFTAENNIIGNYGLQFHSAPGVIITYCDKAQIANNEIHDGYYTGISCGWIWLFGYHVTNNIKLKDNLIYNIGKGMLSDMGGIYMLGSQPGTEISGNVIHDVSCYQGSTGYAGAGIYTDAGASEMLIKNNLIFNCSSYAFDATIARNNSITNNIAAFCGECLVNPGGQLLDYSSMNNYNCNIFLTDGNVPIYMEMATVEKLVDNRNVMWDLTYGDELYFCTRNFKEQAVPLKKAVKKGYVDTSVVTDPMFTDAANYDFTLREDSPVFGNDIGFKAWDYGKAGTVKGSLIGTQYTGGMTAYNTNVSQCVYHPANLKAGTKIARFFRNIFKAIGDFFKNLFGVK